MPISLVDIRIVDPSDNFLPNDGKTTGEIVIRAPWFTQGYYKDSEKTAELWRGGWLHTGDVGYIDKDGYIQITDRLKDVIKTGGEWVSSLDQRTQSAFITLFKRLRQSVFPIPSGENGRCCLLC